MVVSYLVYVAWHSLPVTHFLWKRIEREGKTRAAHGLPIFFFRFRSGDKQLCTHVGQMPPSSQFFLNKVRPSLKINFFVVIFPGCDVFASTVSVASPVFLLLFFVRHAHFFLFGDQKLFGYFFPVKTYSARKEHLCVKKSKKKAVQNLGPTLP